MTNKLNRIQLKIRIRSGAGQIVNIANQAEFEDCVNANSKPRVHYFVPFGLWILMSNDKGHLIQRQPHIMVYGIDFS